MTRVLASLSILGLLALGGCSSIPKVDLSEYPTDRTEGMEPVENMPSEAALKASQERARVVVLRGDDDAGDPGRRQLGEMLTREVEALLGANGVEVVDRSLASSLDEEIRLCELQGRKCGSGVEPSVARYAVKASLTNASYGAQFVSQQVMTGGNTTFLIAAAAYPGFVSRERVDGDNDRIIVRAHYQHSASVGTLVRVYEIPSLRELRAVNGSGSESSRSGSNASMAAGMLGTALKEAVGGGKTRAELLNVFAPRGYVIGRRDGGKGKIIFKASVGSAQGLTPGAPVVIFTEQQSTNPVTKKVSVDQIPVATATVSNLVEGGQAWIVPDDPEKAAKVRLGDMLKVQHD